MSNPYEAPAQVPQDRDVRTLVNGPAIALIIVSVIAIVLGSLALILDIVLIVTGIVERMEEVNDGPISEYTQITIRSIWGLVLLVTSSFVLYGAIQMYALKKYGTARAAAIVAMIPLLGPCCFLGIPFGIWALVVLGKPGVRQVFR